MNNSTIRPVVADFATTMNAVMDANDHKRGWSEMSRDEILRRMAEEAHELLEAIDEVADGACRMSTVIREAADVANFAAFLQHQVVVDRALERSMG